MNMFRNAAVLVTAAVLASCGEQTDERQQSNGPADKASISGWVIGASLPGSFGPGYILVHEKLGLLVSETLVATYDGFD